MGRNLTLAETFRALSACPRCGKSTAVRSDTRGMPDYLHTHPDPDKLCTCPGGTFERIIEAKYLAWGYSFEGAANMGKLYGERIRKGEGATR